MACLVPHTYDEIKSMVEKQIQEDRGRQLAIMNLGHQFDDAITAKDELRKAYEECRDIPLMQRALIENFLKIESELDQQMQNALLPVKYLLQFHTVSKQWKFSINNFDFIRNYGVRERNSFASSKGVWCFAFGENSMLLLWNPSIKKSVGISVPNYTFQPDSPKMIFSFGIYLVTLEPTLLKINYPLYSDDPWDCHIIYAWALEVEGGFVSSCSLLFTIPHPACHFLKLLGFSKDNQPIVEATIVQQWDGFEVLKVLENSLEVLKVLENNLESMKLQENRPVHGLVPLSKKKSTSKIIFPWLLKSKEINF
ncbi:hypothetical protein Tco_0858430 [Tanacetum coccineum]|uniref:Uncharacterized protein n=1 Tax=Tanacetum coccineum TaxID=301880 RepID=A0ABQ5BD40_9ASTR